jgi:hypothetical protein
VFRVSDKGPYESRLSRKTGYNWIPLLIVVLVVVNTLVLSYFVGQVNENVARLDVEFEAIEFQLSSATNEIARLRDSIAIQSQGNAARASSLWFTTAPGTRWSS